MNFIEEKILEKGNVNEKLALRFPPENSGYLHLGHVKSICLNFGLAEKYNGICNLRFDDTNPTNESTEFTNSIIDNIKWLGFTPNKICYTSDYFHFIYDCAIVLIKKGLAYVDDSTSEEIANLKGTPTVGGKNSPFKNRSIEENLDLFERMKNGEFVEGSKTLRASIDMTSLNMFLRDPILFRIINKKHDRVGNSNIYPMYDFAHPISDYVEGISDSLCTLEFELHRPLYNWILENLDFKNRLPEETEFSRLNMEYTVMSKRKLKLLVENNIVDSWSDPRLPTISALKRKGYTAKSLRYFCDKISVTRNDVLISNSVLEECLREELNETADRFMSVLDPVKLIITNYTGEEILDIEYRGDITRKVPFTNELWIEREDFKEIADKKYHRLKLGEEVRLKGAYVIKANSVVKEGDVIKEIHCTYDPLTKSGMLIDRKIKGTIHWVSCKTSIDAEIREYSNLFTEVSPDKSENFLECLNKDSLKISTAKIEPALKELIEDKAVQFIRKGYFILDGNSSNDKMIFNKTVSLKESYK